MLGLPAAVKHDLGGEFETAYMNQLEAIWSTGTMRSVPYILSRQQSGRKSGSRGKQDAPAAPTWTSSKLA